MGVHGLWRLIDPSGKVVPLETLENKVLAVDLSIWLHQAIKGFRDSKGAPLPNAHLLAIYHRVCKLLYFKIKPVFVFDGGVPNLKKETIAKRNQLKSKHTGEVNRIQKQLLNTLLKHSAINKVLSERTKNNLGTTSSKISSTTTKRDESEDLFKLPPSQLEETISSSSEDEEDYSSSSFSTDESKFHPSPSKNWDIYTIDEKSKEFLALPADIRYEILSDIKETRKQSSWGRIHEMPTQSDDFSSYQMKRLLKRQSVQASLEEAEKEMGGHSLSLGELETLLTDQGVLSTKEDIGHRIAKDTQTRYLYIKDVKKAIEEARKDEERKKLAAIAEEEEMVDDPEDHKIKDEVNFKFGAKTRINLKKNERFKDAENTDDIDNQVVAISEADTTVEVEGKNYKSAYEHDLALAIQLSLEAEVIAGCSGEGPSTSKSGNFRPLIEGGHTESSPQENSKDTDKEQPEVNLENTTNSQDSKTVEKVTEDANTASEKVRAKGDCRENTKVNSCLPFESESTEARNNSKESVVEIDCDVKTPENKQKIKKLSEMSFLENFNDADFASSDDDNVASGGEEAKEDREIGSSVLSSAKNYMLEYSGLTPAEVAKIIGRNAAERPANRSIKSTATESKLGKLSKMINTKSADIVYVTGKKVPMVENKDTKKIFGVSSQEALKIAIPTTIEIDQKNKQSNTEGEKTICSNLEVKETTDSTTKEIASSKTKEAVSSKDDKEDIEIMSDSDSSDDFVEVDDSIKVDESDMETDYNKKADLKSNFSPKTKSELNCEVKSDSATNPDLKSKRSLHGNANFEKTLDINDEKDSELKPYSNLKTERLEIIVKTDDASMEDDIFADIFSGQSSKGLNVDLNQQKVLSQTHAKSKDSNPDLLKVVVKTDGKLTDDIFADIFTNEPSNTNKFESSNTSLTLREKLNQNLSAVKKSELNKLEGLQKTEEGNIESHDLDSQNSSKDIESTSIENSTTKSNTPEATTPKSIIPEFLTPEQSTIQKFSTKQLEAIQANLLEEGKELAAERATKERLATNISDQMYQEAQDLLELFGVPYIIAPMEAEAQCAFLEQLNLTDGTITDDSDIWLFGGRTVYKNFFNQTKHVLEFRSENIQHHFKLNRYQLILLALLVGSDYTTGLQGVGPVTALEVLAAFPPGLKSTEIAHTTNIDEITAGLREFKIWYNKGTSAIPARTGLRSKLKNIVFTDNFPSLQVIQAYLDPTVDTSEEKFSWAKPDIGGLKFFAREKFGWTELKSDEILKPIIKRMEDNRLQKTIQDYFKTKQKHISDEPENKMSKRVKMAVNRIGKGDESSEEDGDNFEKVVKKSKGRKGNQGTKKRQANKEPKDSDGSQGLEGFNSEKEFQGGSEKASQVRKKGSSRKRVQGRKTTQAQAELESEVQIEEALIEKQIQIEGQANIENQSEVEDQAQTEYQAEKKSGKAETKQQSKAATKSQPRKKTQVINKTLIRKESQAEKDRQIDTESHIETEAGNDINTGKGIQSEKEQILKVLQSTKKARPSKKSQEPQKPKGAKRAPKRKQTEELTLAAKDELTDSLLAAVFDESMHQGAEPKPPIQSKIPKKSINPSDDDESSEDTNKESTSTDQKSENINLQKNAEIHKNKTKSTTQKISYQAPKRRTATEESATKIKKPKSRKPTSIDPEFDLYDELKEKKTRLKKSFTAPKDDKKKKFPNYRHAEDEDSKKLPPELAKAVKLLNATKALSRKKVKQIESEVNKEVQATTSKAQASKIQTSPASTSIIFASPAEKLTPKSEAVVNKLLVGINSKEYIHQKEKEKLNLMRNKLKAIEMFRKGKQGPGYVKKRAKVVRLPKDDAGLSESSGED